VKDEQMTAKVSSCILIDGTERQFELANIFVDTPYYTGEVEAMVMENPMYELILGNATGVSNDPNPAWRMEGNAVLTRAQTEKQSKPVKPLAVPETNMQNIDGASLREEQRNDKTLKGLWKMAEGDTTKETGKNGSWKIETVKGVLCRIFKPNVNDPSREQKQVIVPQKYRKQVMSLAHESIVGGHLAARKTADRVTSNFHWPGVISDITRFCRSCDICQRTTPKGRTTRVPLGEMPLMTEPFERIAIDLIGPIKPITERGHRYILTIVDFATRYPEAIALKSIETEQVAEALMSVFCRLGFPKEILSDRGSQFTSELMNEVSRLMSIKQVFTTPYNPRCNGLVERMNGTLKSMLKKMCQEKPQEWDRYLPAVLFAYREVPQVSTGFSPFELLYGRCVRGPMQILKDLWTEDDSTSDARSSYQYVIDLKNRLEETCKLARESLHKAQGEYKHHYDKKARPRTFKVGMRVLLLLPTDHNKLMLQWRGPYEIVEVKNRMDYKIRMGNKTKIFHANLLKEYVERNGESSKETACVAVIEAAKQHDGAVDDEELIEVCTNERHETIQDVNINEELDDAQQAEVKGILQQFSAVFTDQPGTTSMAEHVIETSSENPIRVRPYPIPYAVRKKIDEEVSKMLKMGVIEPSCSPYNSPVVLVQKKDGSTRFCIDFRKVNTVTKFDTHPMGNPEDILANVKNDKYFTKIDLAKGYWQIPMEEKSKEKTSFVTPNGSYQFTRMPFGLVNSGSTFNRMMRTMLDGLEHVDHYVDDILIHTQTWEDHLEAVQKVLQRIDNAGLTIRPSKCLVAFHKMDFTGHVVGNGTVTTETDKVEKVKAAPRPRTKKQVRSFLGLVGFYRKYIANFATVAAPLTDLTKKGEPNKVNWGKQHETAFTELKHKLIKAPILHLPDFDKDFIIRSDASDVGLGAVLLQETDESLFPVAYASYKLLPREKNYSVIERECLGIVYAVKKFESYLYGKHFIVQTDHQPLTYIKRCKIESGRIMRWALFLQNYSFHIEAIKGQDNVGADYMSRIE
jgi:hypothetical protein